MPTKDVQTHKMYKRKTHAQIQKDFARGGSKSEFNSDTVFLFVSFLVDEGRKEYPNTTTISGPSLAQHGMLAW